MRKHTTYVMNVGKIGTCTCNLHFLSSRLCTMLSLTALILLHYAGSVNEIQAINVESYQGRFVAGVKDTLDTSPKLSATPSHKGKCRKQFNVSFLKVHKAGSTTIMNIFLRFAIQHGLNVVLPSKSTGFGFNYLGYGKTVSKDRIVPLPVNETYNILCNHVVYNREAFRSIMPNDTKYIGILREPQSHFRSAMTYFGFYQGLEKFVKQNGLNITGSVLTEFFRNPERFKIGTYYVRNKMSFDLGLPVHKFQDDDYIDRFINDLGNDYGLMLLMEEFDESLVLMKRLLCWDMKDILFVPLNARKKKPNVAFTEEDGIKLRLWNKADFKLYEHFSKAFHDKRKAHGEDFESEVRTFKEKRKQVEEYCIKLMTPVKDTSPILYLTSSRYNEEFQVTRRDCSLMMEPELSMMARLIKEAWSKYNSSMTAV